MPKSQWNFDAHDARDFGNKILKNIIGETRFEFPKSLYAVHDSLAYFLDEKKDALIVDFFAGSGTTLHALNLLNKKDDGKRRCIMITNNEVSHDEEEALKKQGKCPNDEEWRELGIARFVTWPRTKCSILGKDINGHEIEGDYGCQKEIYEKTDKKEGSKYLYKKTKVDVYPHMHGWKMSSGFKSNVAFFKLGFLDKTMVAVGKQFNEMLPTLWMKNGCIGSCPALAGNEAIPDMMILHENRMAILVEENAYAEFRDKVNQADDIDMVFIITDSEDGYREMANGLHVEETCQLYRDYLDNFRINVARR